MDILDSINKENDIKNVDMEDMPALAEEIRGFILGNVSRTGGHLASNLGAVELTMALHLCMDFPADKLIFDVGHQAYTHKILTGRKDDFYKLRQFGGMSGFPKRQESDCDSFDTGHSSTSLSAALGYCMARDLQGEDYKVVAVIGDGALTGGLAYEALNNATQLKKSNFLIVLNDNDMAIDANVGALSSYMSDLHTSHRYNKLRYKTYQFLRRHNVINDNRKGLIMRFSNALKSLFSGQQNIFEGLNIRYFGLYDGHDVKRLVKIFREIKDMTGPKLVHVRTVKGKGFAPAEADPATWHAPGKFDEETGERVKGGKGGPIKYQDVFGKTLVELAEKNDKIVGITAAMPSGTSMSLMLEAMPRRAFDVGISEGHAVTFAGGLAKDGMRPYCAIYSTFLQRGYDSIIHDVAIQGLPVTFCIDRGGIVGEDGVTHHGLFDLAYLRCIPGMTVASPINEHDLRNLMFTAQQDNIGPFAIRYPRGKGVITDWHNEMQALPVGRGRRMREGDGVAVLSIGHIGNEVIEVTNQLAERGINVGHYDMIFVKPIDEDILEEVTKRYHSIITIEDGTVVGGLGSAVAEWMTKHDRSNHLKMLGVQDEFVHQGTVAQLYERCGMDAKSLENAILQMLENNK